VGFQCQSERVVECESPESEEATSLREAAILPGICSMAWYCHAGSLHHSYSRSVREENHTSVIVMESVTYIIVV
jgi:hypothetical protein